MPYVITQPCIDVKDKSCVDVCPVSCIYIDSDDLDRKLYIHPDECIDCGACEPECPVNAIFEGSAVPPRATRATPWTSRHTAKAATGKYHDRRPAFIPPSLADEPP